MTSVKGCPVPAGVLTHVIFASLHKFAGEITNVLATVKPPTTFQMPYSSTDLPAFAQFSRYLPETGAAVYAAKVQLRGDDSMDSEVCVCVCVHHSASILCRPHRPLH